MAKLNFQFTEVGLSVNGHEFYVIFAVPKGLRMRSYSSKAQSIKPLSLQDWLLSDFPVILGRCVHAKVGTEIKLISYRPNLIMNERVPHATYIASSLPDSWIMPFVHLFASQFVNNI